MQQKSVGKGTFLEVHLHTAQTDFILEDFPFKMSSEEK